MKSVASYSTGDGGSNPRSKITTKIAILNILLAPSIPTDDIKLQSLSEVITFNDITCKLKTLK